MNGNDSDLRLPAEQFYWAVLDASIVNGRRTRLADSQLRFLFEPLLPVRLEQVHAVFHRLDSDRILACGVERCVLEEDVPASAVSCGPRAVPAFVNTEIDPSQINLLTGRYAPPVVRDLRRSIQRRFILGAVLCAILLLIGLERRTAALHSDTGAMMSAVHDVYDQVLGPAPADQLQPRDAQFVAELRRLQQTRAGWRSSIADIQTNDVTDDLAALLNHWPTDAHLQTDSISVTPSVITIRADLPTAEASETIGQLTGWSGWQRDQPEISNRADTESSTVTVRLRREDGSRP